MKGDEGVFLAVVRGGGDGWMGAIIGVKGGVKLER